MKKIKSRTFFSSFAFSLWNEIWFSNLQWKRNRREKYPYPASSKGEIVHVDMSRQEKWRYALRSFSYPCLSRCCHWRFTLPAGANGGTHVIKRPPLQFVINQIHFRKLFLKETMYSKFTSPVNNLHFITSQVVHQRSNISGLLDIITRKQRLRFDMLIWFLIIFYSVII